MREFNVILQNSTINISNEYFQLPIDGKDDPIYRERVYCYELYHQMRVNWPQDTPYTLSGEVDKSGHPLIRGNGLDNTKPDFLVHIPGDMGGNFAIIEVKPITASRDKIKKDLETLTAFYRHAQYEKAIYLIYGRGEIDRIMNLIISLSDDDQDNNIELNCIEVFYHRQVNESAMYITYES